MRRLLLGLMVAVSGIAACAGAAKSRPAQWNVLAHVQRPVDLAGPRADGSLILAAGGRLRVLSPRGTTSPFAPAYRGGGGEPYIALAPRGCFHAGTVYALKLGTPRGVQAVTARGMHLFVRLPARGLEDGITFGFGHRLLVTATAGSRTTVYAISCHGRVQQITTSAPRVEGGIAVAPAGFGRFGGQLIAPDELTGRIYAISSSGRSSLIAVSDLPHGQDVGVESEAFLPRRRRFRAVLSDRRTQGNPHPGDDVLLELTAAQLRAAGARGGDLLIASEGGAKADAVRCTPSGCTVRHVADGPSIAHAEGHIAIVS